MTHAGADPMALEIDTTMTFVEADSIALIVDASDHDDLYGG
jgi:hypothetical protein